MATIEKVGILHVLESLVLDFSFGSSTSLALLVCRGDGILKRILHTFGNETSLNKKYPMLCLPPILLLLELHVLLKPGFEGGGRDGPINA